tara:strand:- start:146 stop:307 length:162 start_codon:yes stop_codon:yes gene_type:complete
LPLNKPFCVETSNAEKVVAVPPKHFSAKPMLVISAALTPQVTHNLCSMALPEI